MSNVFGLPDPFEGSAPAVETVTVTDRDNNEVVVDAISKAYPIAAELADKQAKLNALEEENAARLQRVKELDDQASALRKQLDGLMQEKHQLDLELFDYRQLKRQLNNEIFELRRLLAQAIADELASKRMLENKVEFDKRAAGWHYSDKILPHQQDGAFILATNMRAILGDKRGAGKTLTAIASWDMAQCQRILVIVPDDVVSNFVNEIHYWAPHRNVIQLGKLTPAERTFALTMAKQAQHIVVVINYSAWRKDKTLIPSLIDQRFDTVVIDEAHEMKNTSTSAYRGVRQIVLAENVCPKCSGATADHVNVNSRQHVKCTICDWNSYDNNGDYEFFDRCSVKMCVPMTGTVILNKPQDLFALLSLVDPINFRELKDFLRIYCQQNWYNNKWEFKSGGLQTLQKRLANKYIARPGVKTPKQTVTTIDLDIDPETYPGQHRVITQLSEHAAVLLESGKKMTILYTIALITRKRQANVWPAGIKLKDPVTGDVIFSVADDVTESIKLDRCIQYHPMVDEWQGLIPEYTEDGDKQLGARVVVFSQFKGPLEELERRCKEAGISVVRFDGDTPDSIRDAAKLDFDRKYCEDPAYNNGNGYKWQVLLANYKTGGVGLNFTAATETIILDREWNPGKEDQAFGRTDRLGQTQETNVTILRINNTIDVWMDALIEEKNEMIDGFNSVAQPLSDRLLDALKNGDIL